MLNVSASYKLVSCCLIVIKRSVRVKLLRLAVTQEPMFICSYFADDCFMPVAFQYSFPMPKAFKVSLWLPCMLLKHFLHFSGGGGGVCSRPSLMTTDFTSVEKTVARTLLSIFTK